MNARWLPTAAALVVLSGCHSNNPVRTTVASSPATPTPAPPSLVAIQVGVLGNAAANFEVGQRRQLWATGTYSDASTTDLTNTAAWQTSNPVVATVSPGGVVSTGALGGVQITASVRDVVGSLGINVVPPPSCQLTLYPPRMVFGAFSDDGYLTVTAVPSDCRWSVSSDAAWLPFKYDPGRSGNGTFGYSIPGNSTPNARSANLIVTTTGGITAVHTIEQEKPVSCSYVVVPSHTEFPLTGGTASFRVDTTPDDCRWTANIYTSGGDSIVSGLSGTGDGSVTFAAKSTTYPRDGSIEIRGLSGQNPPGIFTFTLR